MKKVLLTCTALAGVALASNPAAAEINLDLGGYFRGYGVYADNDEAAGTSLREFDFRRDTEIHFTGETTTDNGLTIGVHSELALGGAVETDETYLYTSGSWGRVNFGSEDGAAYLLQVGAPSADSNVDGLRPYIQAINSRYVLNNLVAGTATPVLGYDHAEFENTDRLTYLTPKFSGFQAGISYAPEEGQNAVGNGVAGMATSDDEGDFEDLWEVAARWDGEFEGFGLSIGAGYSTAEIEQDGNAAGELRDSTDTWNVGGNVAFGAFSVGAAYLSNETSFDLGGGVGGPSIDQESETWVAGAAWDNGPYHVGASYITNELDNVLGSTDDIETERYTVGGGYTYGPGMTFRGAVAFGEIDASTGTADSNDFTQVTIGTDVQF